MHQQLENYLTRVQAQLKSLSPQRQDEEIQEIRQHLQSLIESNIERGKSEGEAVAEAIRQFGNSTQIGRALRRVQSGRSENPFKVALAGICTLSCLIALNFLGGMVLMCVLENTIWRGPNNTLHLIVQIPFFIWFFMAAPFLAGWVGGMIAPKRAMMSIIPLCITLALYYWLTLPIAQIHERFLLAIPVVCLGVLTRMWMVNRRSLRLIRQ